MLDSCHREIRVIARSCSDMGNGAESIRGIRMEAYTDFAQVYDEFMDNVDYHQWCGYAVKLLKKYGVSDGQLVEIGCGTGTGTMLFAKEGYQMIGIDISQEMLEIAESKKEEENILYVLQDATELELPYTVPAMVSIGDSMNYITDYGDFTMVLKRVNEFLEQDGIFVFDLKTRKYFSKNKLLFTICIFFVIDCGYYSRLGSRS